MKWRGVLRSIGKKSPPPPPSQPPTVLTAGHWKKSQLHGLPNVGQPSPYGDVKIANCPEYRVSVTPAGVVTVEVRLTDLVTGTPCWVVAAQYPG